jgi:hypothetical protein
MEQAITPTLYEAPVVDLSEQTFVVSPWIQIFIVAIVVAIALGGTLLLGLAAYCVLQGGAFKGQWSYDSPGYVKVWCEF